MEFTGVQTAQLSPRNQTEKHWGEIGVGRHEQIETQASDTGLFGRFRVEQCKQTGIKNSAAARAEPLASEF